MSYITSSLSPYRGNLWEESMEILEEDSKWVCDSLKGRGLTFLIAYLCIMSLSLLKVICFLITQSQKPVMTYDHLELHRGMREESITSILARREAVPECANHDSIYPDEIKNQRYDKIHSLRTYLYQHDFTLHVEILKTIKHKRTDEELMEMYRTGELSKPLSTTHITFGDNLNQLLNDVLEEGIDLRKNRLTQETYIVIYNDDFLPLKEKLSDFYNENVKLKFD